MNALFEKSFQTTYKVQEPQMFPVLGLHCSGANGSQWTGLRERLENSVQCFAPDLIGTPSRGPWKHSGPFYLEDEAAQIISEMEMLGKPMHIVGHSYGGALALHIARKRPDLVCSLCLYEPTLFSILSGGSSQDEKLKAEIEALTQAIQNGIEDDCAEFSAQVFTDFWGRLGAWLALSRERRYAMTKWVEKAPQDFFALLNEPDPEQIVVSGMPVTVIVGSETHSHTTRIADLLVCQSKTAFKRELRGAGHLGPFTFRSAFEAEVLRHLDAIGVY